MKRLYFPFIFSLFSFYIHAQDQQQVVLEMDSLQSFSADSLKSLAVSSRYKNPLRAKSYALAYYTRAKSQNDIQNRYNAAYLNAEIYNVLGEKDSAHFFVDESMQIALKANKEEDYYNSLRLKGGICFSYDDYANAILHYTQVYKYFEERNDIVRLAKIRHNIALVENQIGRRKQALMKVKENLRLYDEGILEKEPKMAEYLNTLLNLSNIYTTIADDFTNDRLQYLDSATTYSALGLHKSLEASDLEIHSIFLAIQGIIHQKKGELSKAAVNFSAAEKLIHTLGLYNQLSIVYLHKGKNYFLQNNFDDALKYLLKTDSIITKDDTYSPHLQETYILLATVYEKKGDIKKSLKYFKIFEEKDTENDILIRQVSENLYKKYDIVTFKNKIESLTDATKTAHFKSKILIYVCVFLGIFTILGFWYYKNREKTFKNRFDAVLNELKDLEKIQKDSEEKTSQAYKITDENIQKILDGLEKFEKKELFLQKKCTLNYVAKKVNTNSTYLSKTLQSHKQKKFVQYITDLRLNYALTRLKNDTRFRTYDIKSIASELGFNTAESFSKAFKKRTGIYPSFYIKNLNKIKDEA
ncbi:helix-turn-helix domain-containing protein [uncultured Kordia sp.]|uniref:helix-turn-helix domain-containing protein n=1 Tax=uncultured Kordia sp. TaxID=507699 RepID=UPI00263219AE|nr:helix-turn-helix domain-containing protein [uncultured Kordia sp.]